MIVNEVDEFTAVVPVIDDGDICGQVEHGATAQALANRTKNLNGKISPVYDLLTGLKSSVSVGIANITGDLAAVPFPNETTPFNALNPTGVMGRGLARWIRYLHDRLPGADFGSHAIDIPLVQPFVPQSSANWTTIEDGDGTKIIQVTVGGSEIIRLALPLPSKGFLKQVNLYVKGGDGSPQHGAMPATKPSFQLRRKILVPGSPLVFTESVVGSVTDPSATVTPYEQAHAIQLTGLSASLDTANPSLDFFVRVSGEGGANSVANAFRIFALQAIVSSTP